MLNSQSYFDKQLLRLGRRLQKLYRRRSILVELDPPEQRGWVRTHVLSAKSEEREDREILRALLRDIANPRFSRSPEFRYSRGCGKRRRYFEVEQPLIAIRASTWAKYPPKWQEYFHLEHRMMFGKWKEYYVFHRPDRFELKIEPYWVTQSWITDPTVETEIAQIESWLRHRNAWFRMGRLCDTTPRRYREDKIRPEIIASIIKQELQRGEIDGEVEWTASTGCRPFSLLRRSSRIFPSVAQPAEALRLRRSQCRCKSCRWDLSLFHHLPIFPRCSPTAEALRSERS